MIVICEVVKERGFRSISIDIMLVYATLWYCINLGTIGQTAFKIPHSSNVMNSFLYVFVLMETPPPLGPFNDKTKLESSLAFEMRWEKDFSSWYWMARILFLYGVDEAIFYEELFATQSLNKVIDNLL